MEVIDCFCGIGPWARRDPLLPYRPEEILGLMDHFGIDRALVYANIAVEWGRRQDANQMVMDAAREEERFLPAFSMGLHPHGGSPALDDYLAAMRACGARALWLWPTTGQDGELWPWLVGESLEACAQKKIPVFIHVESRSPDEMHRLCTEFPSLRVVLTGVGYVADVWLYPLLRRHPNLHVCLGQFYIPSGGPTRFLEHFPAERLLFGSGLPRFSPGGLIAHLMYAPIDEETREKIFSGNLMRLLSEATP